MCVHWLIFFIFMFKDKDWLSSTFVAKSWGTASVGHKTMLILEDESCDLSFKNEVWGAGGLEKNITVLFVLKHCSHFANTNIKTIILSTFKPERN